MAFLVLLIQLFLASGETCLPDAVPVELRKTVVNGNDERAVGVWVNNWPAGQIASRLAIILIKERLGYNVTEGLGGGTPDAIYALMGCRDPTNANDRGCGDHVTDFHLVLEGWIEDYPQLWRESQANPATAPRNLGSMGYQGRTSVYIPKPIAEEAYFGEGLSLGYYQSYNVSWNAPQRYFEQLSSIDRKKIMPCGESRLTSSSLMEAYVERTGDLEGVVISGGKYAGKCADGYFWLPPACRANEDCFAFFTGGTGWDIEGYMQKATAWNMPIAIAVAATWNDYITLPMDVKSLFYWWVPDPSFLELQPQEVVFPPFDRLKWFAGDRTLASPDIPIEKAVSQDLGVLAPTVEAFVSKLRIEMASLNEIMQDQMESGDDYETVACRWLRAHGDLWKAWIPDETECFPGFGLFDSLLGTYVDNRQDPLHKTCQACASGTFSSKLVDSTGVTYICVECPVGYSQPSGASLSCEACREGEFQDVAGSRTCKPCGVGLYQDERGEDQCKACPSKSTTFGIGSISLLDCGCERGHIDTSVVPGHLNCLTCSAGLNCPRLSSLQSLTTGRAISPSSLIDLGPELVPTVEVGYHSEMGDPIEVFRCGLLSHCPGGLPGTCAGGRVGRACGECAAGSTWVEDDLACRECGARGALWILAAVVILLWLLALPKLLIPGRATKAKATWASTFNSGAGILLHHLQIMGVVATLGVEWPTEVRALMRSCQALILDHETSGVACAWGGPAGYVATTLAFPASTAWLLMGFWMMKLLPAKFRLDFSKTQNAIGQLLQVSFTLMSTLALAPLMCYGHPNGQISLLRYPNVLCFSDEHLAMLPAGLALLAESCLFVALCGYLAWIMPAKAAKGSRMHLTSARFLFFKFRPDRWWYGVPLLLKGLALSVPLVLAADHLQLQAFFLVLVLEVFLCSVCLAWPWKVPVLNLMDCQASASVLLVVSATSFWMRARETGWSFAADFLAWLMCLSLLVLLLGCGVTASGLLTHLAGREVKCLDALINFRASPSPAELVLHLESMMRRLSSSDASELKGRIGGLNFSDIKIIMDCIAVLELELLELPQRALSEKAGDELQDERHPMEFDLVRVSEELPAPRNLVREEL